LSRVAIEPRARTYEVWIPVHRKLLVVALNLAVVVAVIGGTAAFADAGKHVTLVVDGNRHDVTTYSDTVGTVLAERHLRLDARDSVSPGVDTSLADGLEIDVRLSRRVMVDVDGRPRQVWTTAATVGDLVRQLGLDHFGVVVTPPLTVALPLDTAHVSIGLPDTLVIKHQQWRTTIVTAAPTVGRALRQAGIHLSQRDYTSLAPTTPLTHRMTVTVVRIRANQQVRNIVLPYRTVTQYDSALPQGQSQVMQVGRPGEALARVTTRAKDGHLVARHRTVLRVLRAPVVRIVRVGTATATASVAYGPPGDGLNWAALAECESGGNPAAVSPYGYYGLYQFALSTWYSVGGTGNPVNASPSEQTYRAQLLYARSGSAPWPVCGVQLYS
jgi:resuscitation-promoting factor RpfB